jgi:hypothetical protein
MVRPSWRPCSDSRSSSSLSESLRRAQARGDSSAVEGVRERGQSRLHHPAVCGVAVSRRDPAPVIRDYGRAAQVAHFGMTGKRSKDHLPTPPSGRNVVVWSPRTQQPEVNGEWYRAENWRDLSRGTPRCPTDDLTLSRDNLNDSPFDGTSGHTRSIPGHWGPAV